jgi:hypothetical protein
MSLRQLRKIACQPKYACNNRSAAFGSMGLFRSFGKLHEQTQPPSSRIARTNSREVCPAPLPASSHLQYTIRGQEKFMDKARHPHVVRTWTLGRNHHPLRGVPALPPAGRPRSPVRGIPQSPPPAAKSPKRP